MKTKTIFFVALLFFAVHSVQSQISVNVTIGTPPTWGPEGNEEARFYYIPDIEIYFDIKKSEYIYYNNGSWNRSRKLPSYCEHYNLYKGYKVVLTDYYGNEPYVHFKTHKAKYYKGYKGRPQKTHEQYQNEQHHDKSHGNEHGHGTHDANAKHDKKKN